MIKRERVFVTNPSMSLQTALTAESRLAEAACLLREQTLPTDNLEPK
jgi:hypothetical protein